MDTLTGVGAFPLVELGFMPQALSTHPTPYRNSSTTLLDGGCFYPPKPTTPSGASSSARGRRTLNGRYPTSAPAGCGSCGTSPTSATGRGRSPSTHKLYDTTEAALHAVIPDAPLGGPAVAGAGGLPEAIPAALRDGHQRRHGRHRDASRPGDVPREGRRRGHQRSRRDGPRHAAALHQAGFKAVAAFAAFKQTPIYVTEADPEGCAACPASSDPADALSHSRPRTARTRSR